MAPTSLKYLFSLYILLLLSTSAFSHALRPRYINAPKGELGVTLDGPATGKGVFESPTEVDIWYVGENKKISWISGNLVDTSRPRGGDGGLLTLGWLLYRYPEKDFSSKADYDPKDRLWDLGEGKGTYDWIVSDACLGSMCYFNFHYFIKNDDNTGPYAFFYSQNFTVLPKPQVTTVTQIAPTATVTVGPNTRPEENNAGQAETSGSGGGGSGSVGKIVGPVVGVVCFLAILLIALFFWRKRKRSQANQPPNVPPPPPEYGHAGNVGYTSGATQPSGYPPFQPQKVELQGSDVAHELPVERHR